MKTNKKGFTLIELLAVIVILAIIVLIAINEIGDSIEKSNKNSVIASAQTFIKAIENETSISRLTKTFEDGVYSVADLYDMGLNVTGDKPSSGMVTINSGDVVSGCLVYQNGYALIKSGKASYTEEDCSSSSVVMSYAYTGGYQVFDVPISGYYKLETWGAQGGVLNDSFRGGYGAYATGEIFLKAGTKLYIYVGGQGLTTDGTNSGYNGGGNAGSAGGQGGGGGATHIATVSGLLSTLSGSRDNILIVAAGGGGFARYACSTSIGGNGGGYIGTPANLGGTQLAGGKSSGQPDGTFGAGAYNYNTGSSTPGAGAGYYGGGTQTDACVGGGGSSYIDNYELRNGAMYCADCTPSTSYRTKTYSVSCVEGDPVKECAKKGNGAARITLVSEAKDEFKTKFPSYTRLDYIQATGTQYINTGIKPDGNIGFRMIKSSANVSNDYVSFGARSTTNTSYRFLVSDYYESIYFTANNLGWATYRSSTVTANTKYYVSGNYKGDKTFMVGGQVVSSTYPDTADIDADMYIFGWNTGVLSNPAQMKLYRLEFTKGQNIVANYIPCNKDSDIGLCDLVSGEFKGNDGTGTFIGG